MSRGLCHPCYNRYRNVGRHVDHPARLRKSADTVDLVDVLARRGATKAEVLAALGVTWEAVTRAHQRAGEQVPARYRYGNGARKTMGSARVDLESVTV
jgi:hypothetical protein